jgi:SMODS and SLOG-associating 2TM effector domain 1
VLYREARVQDQLSYYGAAASEYERANAQGLAVGALLLSVTTLAAALAGLDIAGKSAWAVVAVVVPAISTALAAYEALFGFERIGKLYGDAARSISRLREPDLATVRDDTAAEAEVAKYAAAVETIFRNEQAQWGQLTAKGTSANGIEHA